MNEPKETDTVQKLWSAAVLLNEAAREIMSLRKKAQKWRERSIQHSRRLEEYSKALEEFGYFD